MIERMKRTILLAISVAAGLVLAHDEPKGKAISITGVVVDSGCYMSHGGKGDKHVACAVACAKNGVPLAIVDDAGKLYLPVATDHTNQNKKLMEFVEKKVKVDGTLVEKGGISGIAIKSVAAAE